MDGSDRQARSRRSKGCLACRKAKVKCGEEQPRCARCSRTGAVCQYPDPLNVDFCNENRRAAARAQSLWRQRATSIALKLKSQTDPQRGIRYSPDVEQWHVKALAAFYRDFACDTHVLNPWTEFFQMLPNIRQEASGSSSQAILAVALAHHSRKRGVTHLEVLARTEYSKAIELIRHQLQVQDGLPTTDTLLSISLMALFETLLPSSSNTGDQPWRRHQYGAIVMVQRAESQAPKQAIDPRLLKFTYFQTIIGCLNTRSRPPLQLHWWMSIVNPLMPVARLFCLMYQTALYQADMDNAMNGKDAPPQIRDLATAFLTVDGELQAWESMLPPRFQFHERDSPPAGHPGAPRTSYVFQSLWTAMPYMIYFAMRALIHENLLKCSLWLLHNDPTPSSIWPGYCAMARDRISEMIAHVCRSVNWVLEDHAGNGNDSEKAEAMRGLAVLWPLFVVSAALEENKDIVERVGLDLTCWVGNALRRVHRLVGIRVLRL